MTILSVIVIVLLIYGINKRKSVDIFIYITALAIAFESMMSVGDFLKLGSFRLGYSEFLILIDVIFAITIFSKNNISKKIFFGGLGLIVSCIFSLLVQLVIPYEGAVISEAAAWDAYYFHGIPPTQISIGFAHIKELIHLLIYIIILSLYFILPYKTKYRLLHKSYAFEKVFIWYGIFEVILVKFFNQQSLLKTIIKGLVGDSYLSSAENVSLGVGSRLQGLKSEPSMYAIALLMFIFLAVILYYKDRKKEYIIYSAIAFFLLIFSLSFNGIVCLFLLLMFGVIKKYQTMGKRTKYLVIFCFLLIIPIITQTYYYLYETEFDVYYLKRIHLALINMDDLSITGWKGDDAFALYDGSTAVRLVSMLGTFEYFIERPWLGLALGSTYGHSSYATILSSIGVIGWFFWAKFTFFCFANKTLSYYIAFVVWSLFLCVGGVGLFQFYGVENIVVVSFFKTLYVDNTKIDS